MRENRLRIDEAGKYREEMAGAVEKTVLAWLIMRFNWKYTRSSPLQETSWGRIEKRKTRTLRKS